MFIKNLQISFILFSLASYACIAYADKTDPIHLSTRNNVQGMVFAENHSIYTLEHPSGKKEASIYVNHEKLRKKLLSDENIGHQGFGIQEGMGGGKKHIWSSDRNSPYAALLFMFNANKIASKRRVLLFDDSFFDKNETMPTISSDNRFLIARGRISFRKMVIRVYDLNKVNEEVLHSKKSTIDLTGKYIYQWQLPVSIFTENKNTFSPLQAMASDGNKVIFLLGDARLNAKSIYSFSLNGQLIYKDTKVNVGLQELKNDLNTTTYEPEGISIIEHNKVRILFLIGSHKSFQTLIYDYYLH